MMSRSDWSDPGFGCVVSLIVVCFIVCVTAYNIVLLFAPDGGA